ncbi:hypothetical protein [Aureimonas glaciei]|jgi:hypothetical protein|uniref:Uncharacterized protein n=1 Tax=Aureimonas glaciei TaxID=1776957 RepID=A0A916Y3J3_9HYPH|nr:hypothetical protein [Aureimonas glaciei]GGD29090.1 hypothetical protein GCM10011335_35270 [Aureimonas glaciei]
MKATHITPTDLLAALEAFSTDRDLQTQGKAIRVLVTDMLIQLGYLPPAHAEDLPPGDDGLGNR